MPYKLVKPLFSIFIIFFLFFAASNLFAMTSKFDKLTLQKQNTVFNAAVTALATNDSSKILAAIHPYPINSIHDEKGETLFHIAVRTKNTTAIPILKKLKLNINKVNNMGLSPLHVATFNKDKSMVEILLANKANINIKDKEGRTPLHFSTLQNDKDFMEFLLEHKADINVKDINGMTPLFYAVDEKDLMLASYLIDKGADVNAKTFLYRTPLHFAAQNNDIDMVNLLLAHKARVNARDRLVVKPSTPLNMTQSSDTAYSITNSSSQTQKILKDNGAKLAKPYYKNNFSFGASYIYGQPFNDKINGKSDPISMQYIGMDLHYYVTPELSLFWGYYYGMPVAAPADYSEYNFIRVPGSLLGLESIFSMFSTSFEEEFKGPAKGLFYALLALSAVLPEGISWDVHMKNTPWLGFSVDIDWASATMIIPKNSSAGYGFSVEVTGEVGGRINFLLGENLLLAANIDVGFSYTSISFVWEIGLTMNWLF